MLKPGVRVYGIRPELVLALGIAREVYRNNGELGRFVITSVSDGAHGVGSLHFAGAAADLRLPGGAGQVVIDMKAALGEDFDVVLESDHIHLEYQPKRAY